MPPRILIADDQTAVLAVIRLTLERRGFLVVTASDGLEAWRKLQEDTVDLVITDQQMPWVTGIELCKRMRQDHRLAQIPVIMLTAKRFELDAEALHSALGISRCLPKPFSPRELARAVEEQLATARDL